LETKLKSSTYFHRHSTFSRVPFSKKEISRDFVRPRDGALTTRTYESSGLTILEYTDEEDVAVRGFVESLFGVGKVWSSFITNVVLGEGTWKGLLNTRRCAVEAAADGLGLSIDELRRRLRAASQEEAVPCAIIVNKADEGYMRSIANGDEVRRSTSKTSSS